MRLDRTSLILAAVLFVSLAGNFFMGGLLMARGSWEHHAAARPAPVLSAADKKALDSVIAERKARFDALLKELGDIREDVRDATHAEPFTQEDLDDALRLEKRKKMEVLQFMRDTHEKAQAAMSKEGRSVLLKMGPRRGPGPFGPAPGDVPFLWEEVSE